MARTLGLGSVVALVVLPIALVGCPRDKQATDSFATSEAQQALEESALESQAEALSTDVVELSTNFTIGDAVQAAAQELHDFVVSQVPCATVSLNATTLTVDYGTAGNTCLYHGHLISGRSEITISRNDSSEVVVEHTWGGLSNGVIQIDGTATVTYDVVNPSRHVEHQVTVTRLNDGLVLEGSGDRIQKPLPAGLSVGFAVSGTRDWTSPRGESSLIINGVQMRWIDPVPQAGTYQLTTPKHRQVELAFSRVDTDTIQVTVSSGSTQFKFNVSKAGSVTRTD
jgi:hypothetical protein